jgi:octaprenyl-diphosphate synthase
VAAELIHNATLLHDDVIDDGDFRRGTPAARVLFGNAASILAGDWVLIQALKRVRRAAPGDHYDRALGTIEEMVAAEALQLANRGRLDTSRADYFQVIEGKTAALFRWALFSGARAGALPDSQCDQLDAYGTHVGTAFQLVDDVLDFAGDPDMTGKSLFGDLREGKMTYPLLLALERDTALRPVVEELLAQPFDQSPAAHLVARVIGAVHESGAADDCLDLAHERVAAAIACLGPLPRGRARSALVTLAEAVLYRAS